MLLKTQEVFNYLKNRLLYDDYERQIAGESIDYFGDLWNTYGGEMSNHITALLVRRMEKGFKNKDEENGYREGLVALTKFYSSCLARKKNNAETMKKAEKKTNKVVRRLI